MATDSAVRSVTNTLSTTVADAVTLTQAWPAVEVTNHDATNNLYFRMDGVTAVGSADGTTVVLPGSSKVARSGLNINETTGVTSTLVSVVGSGNVYTVEGVA